MQYKAEWILIIPDHTIQQISQQPCDIIGIITIIEIEVRATNITTATLRPHDTFGLLKAQRYLFANNKNNKNQKNALPNEAHNYRSYNVFIISKEVFTRC